jgi:hypothetical protein
MREILSLRIRIGIAAVIITSFALHISGSMPGPSQRDRTALESIEHQWLDSEHNRAVRDRILAEDFLHPVTQESSSQSASISTGRSPIRRDPATISASIDCKFVPTGLSES